MMDDDNWYTPPEPQGASPPDEWLTPPGEPAQPEGPWPELTGVFKKRVPDGKVAQDIASAYQSVAPYLPEYVKESGRSLGEGLSEIYRNIKRTPEAAQQGVEAAIREYSQTGEALQGKTPTEYKESPYAEQYEWSDILNPLSSGIPKAVYQVAKQAPMLVGGLTGAAIGSELGPYGTFSGGIIGAGVFSAAQELGPYFLKRLKENPDDPDGAFNAALEDASISGGFSAASWALFAFKPFAGELKNLLFQAFGVQPTTAVGQQALTNIREGQPIEQGLGEAYAQGAVGTAIPMLGHHLISRAAAGRKGVSEGERAAPEETITPEISSETRFPDEWYIPTSAEIPAEDGKHIPENLRTWLEAEQRNPILPRREEQAQEPSAEVQATEAVSPVGRAPKQPQTPAQPRSLIAFLRSLGGIRPSGETRAMNAEKIPGLISNRGLTPDRAREALIDAGYLREDPNANASTSIADFYDLLDRAVRGERVMPEGSEQFEQARIAKEEKSAERLRMEQDAISALDEIGLREHYDGLSRREKLELQERIAGGEDAGDVLEDLAVRYYNDLPSSEPNVRQRALHNYIPGFEDETYTATAPQGGNRVAEARGLSDEAGRKAGNVEQGEAVRGIGEPIQEEDKPGPLNVPDRELVRQGYNPKGFLLGDKVFPVDDHGSKLSGEQTVRDVFYIDDPKQKGYFATLESGTIYPLNRLVHVDDYTVHGRFDPETGEFVRAGERKGEQPLYALSGRAKDAWRDQLQDFLRGENDAEWLEGRAGFMRGGFRVYVRKGLRNDPSTGETLPTLDLANIQVDKKGRGTFTDMLEAAKDVARENGIKALYVENVLTDKFANYFENKEEWVRDLSYHPDERVRDVVQTMNKGLPPSFMLRLDHPEGEQPQYALTRKKGLLFERAAEKAGMVRDPYFSSVEDIYVYPNKLKNPSRDDIKELLHKIAKFGNRENIGGGQSAYLRISGSKNGNIFVGDKFKFIHSDLSRDSEIEGYIRKDGTFEIVSYLPPDFMNKWYPKLMDLSEGQLRLLGEFREQPQYALSGFFHGPEKAVEDFPQDKATPEQWRRLIEKQPGWKDYVEWTELDKFLEGKKSISKDALLSYMRAHSADLDERILGGHGTVDIDAAALRLAQEKFDSEWPDRWEDWLSDRAAELRESFDKKHGEDAHEDALPSEIIESVGAPDEMERLKREAWDQIKHQAIYEAQQDARSLAEEEGEGTKFEGNKIPGGVPGSYRELLIRLPDLQPYTSKHFKDQDLVHIRFDDRIGPDGERILFIHEIQSDLHQAGRRDGYRAAPNAPFKGDLWLELALKRALRYAIENGYDAISVARSDQIGNAVDQHPSKLALQYDQKIIKYLDRYVKKWGARVERKKVVNDISDAKKAEVESLTNEGLSLQEQMANEGNPVRRELADRYQEIYNRLLELEAAEAGSKGTNPIISITPQMREAVMEGQAYNLTQFDYRFIEDDLNRTGIHLIDRDAVNLVHEEATRFGSKLSSAPYHALVSIERSHDDGSLRAYYEDQNGEVHSFPTTLDRLAQTYGFYWRGRIYINGFNPVPGNVAHTLRGIIGHEAFHSVQPVGPNRKVAGMPLDVFKRLVDHGKSLGILERSPSEFARIIGDPLADLYTKNATMRSVYEKVYAGRRNFGFDMDSEEGAHLVQEYYHDRARLASPLSLKDFIAKYGPVIQDLEDFYAGRFRNKRPGPAVRLPEWLQTQGGRNFQYALSGDQDRERPANEPRTPTEVKVYHGTADNRYWEQGIHFYSDNPSVSNEYTRTGAVESLNANPEAYPPSHPFQELRPQSAAGFIETKNFKTVDFEGEPFIRMAQVIENAKKEGYEGLIAKNVSDTGGVQNQYITWTPGTVRSALSEQPLFALAGERGAEKERGKRPNDLTEYSVAMSSGAGFVKEAVRTLPRLETAAKALENGDAEKARLNLSLVLQNIGALAKIARIDEEPPAGGAPYKELEETKYTPYHYAVEDAFKTANAISRAFDENKPDVIRSLAQQLGADLGEILKERVSVWRDTGTPENTKYAIENLLSEQERQLLASQAAPEGEQPLYALSGDQDRDTGRSMRRDLDNLGFYSQALEAAKGLKQPKGTPQQMLAQLKKAGAKDAEIEATGLDKFLEGKKSVTRDDIIKHLEENRVGLKEIQRPSPDEESNSSPTKWSSYSLDPRNPTYRETVLHLPQRSAEYHEDVFNRLASEAYDAARKAGATDAEANDLLGDIGAASESPGTRVNIPKKFDTPEVRAAVDKALQATIQHPDFLSGHFPEPNIIGHMQTSLVRDKEGHVVFNIDQIQSDWGQRLRDKGVRDEAKIAELTQRLNDLHAQQKTISKEARDIGLKYSSLPELVHMDEFDFDLPQSQTTIRKVLNIAKEKNPEIREKVQDIHDELHDIEQKIRLTHAEWETARAATPGNPLVNTTSQWLSTTLKRAIKQATEAGADYIAIPSGDTVLSYNPGDEHGMTSFYGRTHRNPEAIYAEGNLAAFERDRDAARSRGNEAEARQAEDAITELRKHITPVEGIVPLTLKKLLRNYDSEYPTSEKVEKLITPTKGETGHGFTLFPLTDAVKSEVMGEGRGQPLFALAGQERDTGIDPIFFRQSVRNALESGRTYQNDPLSVASVHAVIKQFAPEVPTNVPIGTLVSVKPIENSAVVLTFRSPDGSQFSYKGWKGKLFDYRAGWLPDRKAIVIYDFGDAIGADPKSGVESLGGRIRHESIHAFRQLGYFTDGEWATLVGHANNLRVLDQRASDFFRLVGDPTWYNAINRTLRDYYNTEYADREPHEFLELLDQEAVAHMLEIYHHAAMRPEGHRFREGILRAYAPVMPIFDRIFSGEIANRTPGQVKRLNRAERQAEALSEQPLYAFAGERAKTADLDGRKKAEALEVLGRKPEAIHSETGWYRGTDGKWRFEIDDSQAHLRVPLPHDPGHRFDWYGKLGELLKHDALFKAYPFLGNVPVHVGIGDYYEGSSSYFSQDGFVIRTEASKPVLSIILHEIQHAIQEHEGFDLGSSPNIRIEQNHILRHDIENEISRLQEAGLGHNIIGYLEDALEALKKTDLYVTQGRFLGPSAPAQAAYRRTSGEIEARNVQRRQNLSAEQRRETFPEETQDVPNAESIRNVEGLVAEIDPQIEAKIRDVIDDHLGFRPKNLIPKKDEFSNAEEGFRYIIDALQAGPVSHWLDVYDFRIRDVSEKLRRIAQEIADVEALPDHKKPLWLISKQERERHRENEEKKASLSQLKETSELYKRELDGDVYLFDLWKKLDEAGLRELPEVSLRTLDLNNQIERSGLTALPAPYGEPRDRQYRRGKEAEERFRDLASGLAQKAESFIDEDKFRKTSVALDLVRHLLNGDTADQVARSRMPQMAEWYRRFQESVSPAELRAIRNAEMAAKYSKNTPLFRQESRPDSGGGRKPPGPPSFGDASLGPEDHIPRTALGRKVSDIIASSPWLGDLLRSIQMGIAPMTAHDASAAARAAAKDLANTHRLIQTSHNVIDKILAKEFTAKQRKKMFEAMDEESVNLQRGGHVRGEGIDRLTPEERATVEALSRRNDAELPKALAQGVISKDFKALPSYVPRIIVQMTGGEFTGVRSSDKTAPRLDPLGNNIKTTTPHLKKRKYLTVAETEDAAKKKFGADAKVVRDIRTLPLATARLQEAISGRMLINEIKRFGEEIGEPMVSMGGVPDGSPHKWFTIDAPAFYEWGPLLKKTAEGKWETAKYEDGSLAFERKPIYIRSDWEGPLRAVMSSKGSSDAILRAMAAIKAKAVGFIMINPLAHNLVIYGKALPVLPMKDWWTLGVSTYMAGNKVKNNPELLRRAVARGLAPIGQYGFRQEASGYLTEAKPGGGESLESILAGKAVGLLNKEAGERVTRAIDKIADFKQNKLLWDRIADLQYGLWKAFTDNLQKKGLDEVTADRIAAHFANRYAGSLPQEFSSKWARIVANLALFSRSFTFTNLFSIGDMFTGLPQDVQAQILRDSGPEMVRKARGVARLKAAKMVAMDILMMYVLGSVVQSAANAIWGPINQRGYSDRIKDAIKEVTDYPAGTLLNPGWFLGLPERISATAENPEDKRNRIFAGTDAQGNGVYFRLPFGKVGEELEGWMLHPARILQNKEAPLLKAFSEAFSNDLGERTGHRHLYNPNPKTFSQYIGVAADVIGHFLHSMGPMDAIVAGKNVASHALTGKGSDFDYNADLRQFGGFLTGIPFSKSVPPEEAAIYKQQEQYKFRLDREKAEIMRLIREGNIEEANKIFDRLKITPQDRRYITQRALRPHMGERTKRKFGQSATEEEKSEVSRYRNPMQ